MISYIEYVNSNCLKYFNKQVVQGMSSLFLELAATLIQLKKTTKFLFAEENWSGENRA